MRTACPVCASGSRAGTGALPRKYLIRDTSVLVDGIAGFGVVECGSCRLIYRTHSTTPEAERALQEIWNAGDQTRWHTAESPGVRAIASLVRELAVASIGRGSIQLADIGPGEGDFLRLLGPEFAQTGIELNDALGGAMASRGFAIVHANIEDDRIDVPRRFDVITAFDVFEHFARPNAALRNIHGLLNDGGLLIVETGNVESYPARRNGPHAWWYSQILEHKILWGAGSLSRALQEAGFAIERVVLKAHKGQRLGAVRPWFKWMLYEISPALYARTSGTPAPALKPPKMPWRDHVLIVARKSR